MIFNCRRHRKSLNLNHKVMNMPTLLIEASILPTSSLFLNGRSTYNLLERAFTIYSSSCIDIWYYLCCASVKCTCMKILVWTLTYQICYMQIGQGIFLAPTIWARSATVCCFKNSGFFTETIHLGQFLHRLINRLTVAVFFFRI